MDPSEAINQERFSAILENQRAIMVNQSTILHNQNKIMRGLEQFFAFIPAPQGALNAPGLTPVAVPVSATPVLLTSGAPDPRGPGEQPAVMQPPRADQISAVAPNSAAKPVVPSSPTTPTAVSAATTPVHITSAQIKPISSLNSPAGLVSQDELAQIKCKSCSVGNFAVQLVRHIYRPEELENRNCSGSRGKDAVDSEKLRFVKETVYDLYGIDSSEKVNTWRHCVRAIDEYLRRPKKERSFQIPKKPKTPELPSMADIFKATAPEPNADSSVWNDKVLYFRRKSLYRLWGVF